MLPGIRDGGAPAPELLHVLVAVPPGVETRCPHGSQRHPCTRAPCPHHDQPQVLEQAPEALALREHPAVEHVRIGDEDPRGVPGVLPLERRRASVVACDCVGSILKEPGFRAAT